VIADIDVLRQSSVLGPVASPPTVWRTQTACRSGKHSHVLDRTRPLEDARRRNT